MAYEVEWSGVHSGGGRNYNVNFSVGLGGANYRDDVMLVQFYLNRVYTHPFGLSGAPDSGLAVDGACGPMTLRWIRAFQTLMQALDIPPSRIRVDGKVSPGPSTISSAHRHYTIVLLNDYHGRLYSDEDVRESPDAPPYLRARLSRLVITHGGGI